MCGVISDSCKLQLCPLVGRTLASLASLGRENLPGRCLRRPRVVVPRWVMKEAGLTREHVNDIADLGEFISRRLFLHFRGGKIAQARCHWQRRNAHTLRTHLPDNFCRRTRTVLHLISTSRYSLTSQYSPTSSTSACMALQAFEAIPSPYHETSL